MSLREASSETEQSVQSNTSSVFSESSDRKYYDMIVFCHLRWEFVYQRPQHLISRLVADRHVLFVEEPIPFNSDEKGTARINKVNENLTILQPKVNSISEISSVLKKYVSNRHVPLAWFYSPAFQPILEDFNFYRIVYDCMDELSMFKGASQEIIKQEEALLSEAHVVFTGGKSLYEAKKKIHHHVHCFPSSVDHSHFKKALNGIAIPQDISHLKKPVVGYYGVIDERVDLNLIRETAELCPEASFVMIGPLAKIGEHDLPRRENIHYLGMRSYDELPSYLKAFDIAMMPFALNDATKFISPTKTLEYMAAKKPIISTAITDVVKDYSNCVNIVSNAQEFCNAIKELKIPENKEVLTNQFDAILNATSWDQTAQKMQLIIKNA